jgi:hypothetical protein
MIPFPSPSPEEIVANNITLSDVQKVAQQRAIDWSATNGGYYTEQTTKVGVSLTSAPIFSEIVPQPNDIGLALYDSPVGQLAWIAAIMKLGA